MSERRSQKFSLRYLLRPTVDDQPARPALHGTAVWTYQHLEDDARRLARRWLASGLEPGDRVALLLPNRPEALLVYLACFKSGLVAVPLDYRYRPPQINYVLRHSGSRVLVTHADRLEEVTACDEAQHIDVVTVGGERAGALLLDDGTALGGDESTAEFRADDVAILFYTSGTTGRPKGVMLTRAALTAGTAKFLARVPLGSADVALVAAPVMRPFALRTQVLPTLHAGSGVVLLEQFTPTNYLAVLRQPPVKTFLALSPNALHQVVHAAEVRREDFAGVRLCISGGDRVPLDLHRAFHALTGLELAEQCGMTETGMYALTPLEVEDALLAHPAVAEACVVGAADPVHWQNVHAFVTLRPGAAVPSAEELRQFAAARLSRPMAPERVCIVTELPRTGTGKIDRDRLTWQVEAGTATI